MSSYQQLFFPILRRFDPERTHALTIRMLVLAQKTPVGRALLRRIAGPLPRRPVDAFGLRFPNELGVAAGFDKNAQAFAGLGYLGFGHVEVGTLTPRPQEGNPRPRIFRLPEDKALINRMGFPNRGVAEAQTRLRGRRRVNEAAILGVSLGKQKDTDLDRATEDYLAVMEQVYSGADYLAINVSSPNTPGLRQLQGRRYLGQLLAALMAANEALAQEGQVHVRPLLLKVSPDLSWSQLDVVLETAMEYGVSGIVACNTTVSRTGLSEVELRSGRRDEIGGLSGRPLRQRSTEIIRYIWRRCAGQLPVVGVGGVMTSADVRQKLDAGAVLVQMYTGLVYGGPGIAGQILRGLHNLG